MSAVLVAACATVVLFAVTGGTDLGEVAVPPGSEPERTGRREPPTLEPTGLPPVLRCLDDVGREAQGCVAWAARLSSPPGPGGRVVRVLGETAWLGTSEGIVSLSTRDGRQRWATATDAPVSHVVPAGSSRLVAVDEQGTAYGLRYLDGAIAWRTPLGSAPASEPAVTDDTAVVPTEAGPVVLALDTGGVVARTSLGEPAGSVVASDGRFVVAGKSGQIYGIDATEGSIVWRASAGSSAPWLSAWRGLLVAVAPDGETAAFTARSGEVRWRRPSTGALEEPVMSPDGRRLLVPVDDDATAHVLDVATGREINQVAVDPSLVGLSLGPQGWLLAMGPTGLTVRDPVDGRLRAGIEHVSARPVGADATFLTALQGRLLVAFEDGLVASVRLPARGQDTRRLADRLIQQETPRIDPETGCPTSVVDQRPYGAVSVGSAVEVLEVSSSETFILDVLVILPDPVTLEVVRLDAPGTMSINERGGAPATQVTLDAGDRRFAFDHPPHWAVTSIGADEGCWAYVVRGAGLVDVVVVDLDAAT